MSAVLILNIKEGENAENPCFFKALVYIKHGATAQCAELSIRECVCSAEQNQLLCLSLRLSQKPSAQGKSGAQFGSAFNMYVFGSVPNTLCFLAVTLVRVAVGAPAIGSLCASRSAKETAPPSRALYH